MSSGSRRNIDNNGFLGIIPITGDHTLELTDVNYLLDVNLGSAITITLPNETTLPFTEIKTYALRRKGAGQVLFAEEAGLTVLGGITEIADTATTTGGMVVVLHTGVNEYSINGKEV